MDRSRQLAHEIQSPLLSLEIRLRKLLDEGARNERLANECLDEIRALRQWLASFLDHDISALRCEDIALDPLLQRIERRFEPIARERRIELRVHDAGARASGDESATERVVSSLVENAIKFSPPGSEVRLSVQRGAESIAIEVSDDGPGVPAGDDERIFEPFYRARTETPGVGMGLAIAKRLAEAQDGRLRFERAPGGGSAFTLTLRGS